jgi:hypothetical protein
MKNQTVMAMVAAAILINTAAIIQAAFQMPSEIQAAAAAQNPILIRPLIQACSVNEAAQVIRDVLVQVVRMKEEPAKRDARIGAVIREAFRARPKEALALAAALGKVMAASPEASRDPAVISAIQAGMIDSVGSDRAEAVAVASSFGNSYTLSMQTIGAAPGSGKTAVATPPPPPVATRYDGQNFS